MELDVKIDMRDFNRAMKQVAQMKDKSAKSDLFYQGRSLIGKLVFATEFLSRSKKVRKFIFDKEQNKWIPALTKAGKQIMTKIKTAGRARAGWIPAWKALGKTNVPRGTMVAYKIVGKEGDFKDKTRGLFPSIELINEVPFIDRIEGQEDKIQQAVDKQAKQMADYILRKTLQRFNNRFR